MLDLHAPLSLLSPWYRLLPGGCGLVPGTSLQPWRALQKLEVVCWPHSWWLECQVLSWRGTRVTHLCVCLWCLQCYGALCPAATAPDSTEDWIRCPEMVCSRPSLSVTLSIQDPGEEASQNNVPSLMPPPVGLLPLTAWWLAHCSIPRASGQSQSKALGPLPPDTMLGASLGSARASLHLTGNIAGRAWRGELLCFN